MHQTALAAATATLLLLAGCGSTKTPVAAQPTGLSRSDFKEVTCGIQVQAKGIGAEPNEVVAVRIQEQVKDGIDISREVVADAEGNFIMNDFCDPKSPNAEVPALWSYKGAKSGRTGKDLITYKLPQK